MTAHTIILGPARVSGGMATDHHFGANVTFKQNFLDPGGPFDRLHDLLGFTDMRFPGGTVTEEATYEMSDRYTDRGNPTGIDPGGGGRFVTYPAFSDHAEEHDARAMLVFPTERTLSDDPYGTRTVTPFGVYHTLNSMNLVMEGAYGPIDIHTIEIGNEFWYLDARMTATEYGTVANTMAPGLQFIIDQHRATLDDPDAWEEPRIAVQAAQGFQVAENAAVIAGLDDPARAAIDTVIQHYYPQHYERIDDFDNAFNRMDDFANAPGFGPLEYFVSEWNIRSTQVAETGLTQASALVEQMQTMLEEGVDYATVWGTQYLNLHSRLSTLTPDADAPGGYATTLTAAGEAFRMMAETLPGTHVLSADTPIELREYIGTAPEDRPEGHRDQLVMHAFADADHTVIFLSSRTDQPMEITLDQHGLVPDYTHLWAQTLGVLDDPTTAVDEGDPTAYLARPHVTTHHGNALTNDETGNIEVTLGAYEMIRLEFTTSETGVQMRGDDQMVDPAANYADYMPGSAHDDRIEGNLGNDTLLGGAGNDRIDGGTGNDVLRGDTGNDALFGNDGDDRITGGAGNDTLIGGLGNDTLQGDGGTDHFIVSVEGDSTITGFHPSKGETLSFLRHYETAQDVLDRMTVEGDDVRITHDDGVTDLPGMASEVGSLAASLSDFMEDSPVAAEVDALLQPAPDGGPPPPPTPEEIAALPDIADDYVHAELLLSLTPSQMAEHMANLSDDAFDDMLTGVNIDILFYAMDDASLAAFMNALDPERLDMVLDDLAPGTVTTRLELMEDGVNTFLPALGTEALVGLLQEVDAEDGKAIMAQMTAETREDLRGCVTGEYPGEDQPDDLQYLFREPPPGEEPEDPEPEPEPEPASGGGSCFVATAAYGDRNHPDVVYLRAVRDRILIHHGAGRLFIAAYWQVGPVLARWLAPYPGARGLTRRLLGRMIARMRRADLVARHGHP
ncbi:CFI-box-CTERM domain-containing protein [Paracoccaceae bacterium Fryx2]|nr:CFI-box-CTERM domain-containing protein [Paracoccaceae bacterium Fryx2]